MCQQIMPRAKHRDCGHEIEEQSFVVECPEAKERGSECENPEPNYSMGMKSLAGKCPDCVAAEDEEEKAGEGEGGP